MTTPEIPESVPTAGRSRFVSYALVAVAGVIVAVLFLRTRAQAILARALPYVRRRSGVKKPALIVNRWSGDGKAERFGLADAARGAGVRVIMLERGDDIVELAQRAIDEGADAIGAAGGDGSLGLVAGVAIERDVPFFCVPVGTRNHFALDLGLDRDDPLSALHAISDGEEILIDHGLAGDRPFLNNVSLGVYAEAVHREEYRENKEQTVATVIAEIGSGETTTEVRFTTPQGEQVERTAMTLVSNNPYVWSGPPDHGRRLRLDAGELGIAVLGSGTTAHGVSGSGVRAWTDSQLRVESDGPIKTGLDGEALEFDAPLDLRVVPKGLRVLVPAGTKPGYVPGGQDLVAEIVGFSNLAHLAGILAPNGD